jgi:hypothetical protein
VLVDARAGHGVPTSGINFIQRVQEKEGGCRQQVVSRSRPVNIGRRDHGSAPEQLMSELSPHLSFPRLNVLKRVLDPTQLVAA